MAEANQLIEAADARIIKNPRDAEALHQRANALADLGNYENAIGDYSRALNLYDDNVEVLIRRGLCHFNLGNFEAAKDDMTAAIEKSPTHAGAHVFRSIVHGRLGDTAAELDNLNTAVSFKADGSMLRLRGDYFMRNSRFAEAVEDFARILEYSEDHQVYALRGEAYLKLSNLERARADFKKSLDLQPNQAAPLAGLGQVYFTRGEYTEAVGAFEQALKLLPNDVKTLVCNSVALFESGRVRAALASAERGLAIKPGLESALWSRGRCENALGYFQQAYETFTELIPTGYGGAYAGRAFALTYLNRLKEAWADYNHALEEDPDDFGARLNRGSIHRALDDTDAALADFDAAHSLRSMAKEPRLYHGDVLLETGQFQQALAEYAAVLESDPECAVAYSGRADALVMLGNPVAAIADYDSAIARNPNNQHALGNRAITKQSLGDHEGAASDYKRILQLNPRNHDAVRRLEALGYRVTFGNPPET